MYIQWQKKTATKGSERRWLAPVTHDCRREVSRLKKNAAGVTLIELLVVVAIIGILSGSWPFLNFPPIAPRLFAPGLNRT